MESFVVRRILSVLPVLLGISLLTFGLSFLTPSDPAELMLDQRVPDKPHVRQFARGLVRTFLALAHFLSLNLLNFAPFGAF